MARRREVQNGKPQPTGKEKAGAPVTEAIPSGKELRATPMCVGAS